MLSEGGESSPEGFNSGNQGLVSAQSEENAQPGYYEGMMHDTPALVVGKLFLTPKFIGFRSYETRASGLLGKAHLSPTGRVLGIAMDKVVDVRVESGIRSKKSRPNWREVKDFERKATREKEINTEPGLLDGAEKYRQLMIVCETEIGLEVALFEVADPELVADRINSLRVRSGF